MQFIKDINQRRNNLINGYNNFIPFTISGLHNSYPGIEKSKYYVITANTKVGKTKLTDFLFVLEPLRLLKANLITCDLHINYISLEESKLEKEYSFISHILSNKMGERIHSSKLKSLKTPLEERILNYLEGEEFLPYLNFIQEKVDIIEHLSTTSQIIAYIESRANALGTYTNGIWTPNNPNNYEIFIIDNYNLLLSDTHNTNIYNSIGSISTYAMHAKKMYGFVIVAVQQQAAAAENIQSLQFRDGVPTLDNLADNKRTGKDANLVLGVYSPYRSKISIHEGLDVLKYKDTYRSISVLADRDYGSIGNFVRTNFDGVTNNFSQLNT